MQYGLIGEKLGHSYSPEIHQKIGDYLYELLELSPEAVVPFLREKNFKAINVTIPYKELVMPHLDEITERAEKIGAVNVIRNQNGHLLGDNTDFFGMTALLERMGVEVKGKKALILGTGGTSKTALAVLESLGAREILRVSRSRERGDITYEEALRDHRSSDLLINTTPVGMYPKEVDIPIDVGAFPDLTCVIDAVYNPLRTELVLESLERDISASGGLYMLAAQAVKASALFFEKESEESTVERVYRAVLREKETIILAGGSEIKRREAHKLFPNAVLSEKVVPHALLRNGRVFDLDQWDIEDIQRELS